MTLAQDQGMTLTLNTHLVLFTHLAHASTNFQTNSCNSFWKIQGFDFFPYKSLCEKIWPWPKIGQGNPSVITWRNYDWLKSPILHTKFHDNRPTDSGGFYLIWRPSWSCDLDPANKLSFPHPMDAPHEIWLQSAQWFQRRRCLKMLTDDRLQTTDDDNR